MNEKKLEIKADIPYEKGGHQGMYAIWFVHDIKGNEFIIKGAIVKLREWIKKYKIPCVVFKTCYAKHQQKSVNTGQIVRAMKEANGNQELAMKNLESRKLDVKHGIDFENVGPWYVSYSKQIRSRKFPRFYGDETLTDGERVDIPRRKFMLKISKNGPFSFKKDEPEFKKEVGQIPHCFPKEVKKFLIENKVWSIKKI